MATKRVDHEITGNLVQARGWYALFFEDKKRIKDKDVSAVAVACWATAKIGSVKKPFVVGMVPSNDGPLAPAEIEDDFQGYLKSDLTNLEHTIASYVASWNDSDDAGSDEPDDSDEEDEDEDDED